MSDSNPEQSEIWWVVLDPVRGSEIGKTRPAVVVSANRYHSGTVRVAVPFTTWQPKFGRHYNKLLVRASAANGLVADSAADAMQARALSVDRFTGRIGRASDEEMSDLSALLSLLFEWSPGT
jgi:mRNA interferase MazF